MSRKPANPFLNEDHSAKPKFKPFQRHHTAENKPVRPVPAPANAITPGLKKSMSMPISPATTTKPKNLSYQKCTSSKPKKTTTQSPKPPKLNENQTASRPAETTKPLSTPDAPRIPPTTPAQRAPLADLYAYLGASTVEKQPTRDEIQPDEQVLWRCSPSSTTLAGSQSTPVPRRKNRKRPRSSSPISTPRMPARHPGEQESFSLNTPISTFKVPMLVDPAADLWNRYSTTTSSSRPPSVVPPPPSNLFNGSSPRNTIESPLALRRAVSCGNEWPSKKRKLTDVGSPIAEDEAPESPIDGSSPRMSRVSDLVEKMHENMGKPTHPSSSEPLPAIDREVAMSSPPPKQQHQPILEPVEKLADVSFNHNSDEDFGDLDLEGADVDMLCALDAAASKANSPAAMYEDLPVALVVVATKLVLDDDDDDEYGDGDDDFYNADLEDLMSKYERENQPTTSLPHPVIPIPAEERTIRKDDDDEFDEFGDFDLDEWNAAEAELAKNGTSDVKRERIQRLLVLDVLEGSYIGKNGNKRQQKVLQLEDEKAEINYRAILRQSWEPTEVTEGDIVNVVGNFDEHGECIIDNEHNFVIVHPDFLLSATVVADSFSCLRLGALKDRVKAINEMTLAAVYGNIIHELFQTSLIANNFSDKFLHDEIDRLVLKEIQQLFTLREPMERAVDHLRTKVPLLQDWAQKFVAFKPQPGAVVKGHRAPETKVCVNRVLDVEEHIWAPKYGLKGNIDVTAEIKIVEGKDRRTLTVPLELKTGRNSKVTSHRAQTMLYTVLMADRYDIDCQCGLLFYSESGEMIRVPALRDELRGMLIGRNALAMFMNNKMSLPPMIQKKHECGRCYAKDTCFVYHKAMEGGTAESSGLGDVFVNATAHILPQHADFFTKWDILLTKEEKDSDRFRKELWTMLSHERENVGRCFSELVIIPESLPTSKETSSKINRYTYRLRKQASPSNFTFLESQINVGEPIVISDETGHFALAKGYATLVTPREISVAVDRRLHNARSRKSGFDADKNQVFAGIMEVLENGNKMDFTPAPSEDKNVTYRLDKDEFANGMAMIRTNLIEMMKKQSNRLRELVIDLKPPKFKMTSTAFPLPSASQNINLDQRNAIEKVMSAMDYALILGMPGTGKTTTIAHIIRALIFQGKSVLLTSYTHTAVDNILLKIKHDGIKILRLGVQNKIHREVQEFVDMESNTKATFDEIHDSLHTPQIVATTCLKINHPVFQERVFDYCIVDEASQITLPVCLGPIRMAKTFILVGDHYQLPPLVKNADARAGGLDVSLFKLLSESHSHAVVNLEHQYRMCKDIMLLSNTLIYDGRLKCGTKGVADKNLHIPNIAALDEFHGVLKAKNMCQVTVPCWIKQLLQEDVKARFVSTDNLDAAEVRKGERIYNPTEAQLTHQLVEALIHTGVSATEIGVISVYRAQIKTISTLLAARPAVEMHTADRFQGRDKEVIIISLVRSNDKQNIGELLNDWRRINVAFTRARTKLIIIGSRRTLEGNVLLGRFIDIMEEKKWIYNLPVDAHLMHEIPHVDVEDIGSPSPKSVITSPMKAKSPLKIHGPLEATKNQKAKTGWSSPNDSMKENVRAMPKKGVASKKSVVGNRPILRDILNELS